MKPDNCKIIPEVGADTFYFTSGSRRFGKHRGGNAPQ